MDTTPWFNGDVKPARPGLYQLKCGYDRVIGYQHWDGAVWGAWDACPDAAFRERGWKAASQRDSWRGLAREPGAD